MSVTTLERIELTIEDLDFDPACQAEFCTVGQPPATHVVIWHMPCRCYQPQLVCQSCVQRLEHYVAKALEDTWNCKFCGTKIHGLLRDLLEVRPLP